MFLYHFTRKNLYKKISYEGLKINSKTNLNISQQEQLYFMTHLADIFYLLLVFKIDIDSIIILKIDAFEFLPKIRIINRWLEGVEVTIDQDIPPNLISIYYDGAKKH
jgi:hypothetical protein